MSSEIDAAIVARLVGTEDLHAWPNASAAQTALKSLLAPDPLNATMPCVFQANLSDTGVARQNGLTVYPILTFRSDGGLPDRRFVDMTVDNPTYSIEVWTDARTGSDIPAIYAQLKLLLEQRSLAPPLPLSAGEIKWSEIIMLPHVLFDWKYRAWVGLSRWRFVEAN